MANLMKIRNANTWELTRRAFLGRSGAGMGILALASLLKPALLKGAEGSVGSMADDICIIRSMRTEAINHDPAHTFMNTGTTISGRPAMGSWLVYGLGSDSDNLPGFVVLTSTGKSGQSQPISARQWHSGFLPSRFQGVHFRSTGDPVLYVSNPKGVTADRQRDVVDAVNALNQMQNG